MREWLSGGVSPCQGEGRGFESRLALSKNKNRSKDRFLFFCEHECSRTHAIAAVDEIAGRLKNEKSMHIFPKPKDTNLRTRKGRYFR